MLEAPISGPRPLQLASGSIIIPPSSRSATRRDSIPVSTCTQQTEVDEDTHQPPSLYTPPSSDKAKSPPSSRRHSSISYIHSGTPLSHSHPTSPQFPPLGQLRSPASHLSRNKSLSGPVPRNVKDKRTSYGPFIGDSKMADAVEHLKERPPVTLAEKHAELLHFIAQKESKCLELKSQLAIHEAELLQLKRKWELIVNRGFEKSQTTSTLSPPSPFLTPSPTSAPYAKSPLTPSSPYFPLPGAHTHAPVLEGIKEGVQGMSRLIAAGFESIAGAPIEPSPAGASLHQPPLPLLLRSTPKLDRKPARRHGQNESQSSSSSTVNSISTLASDSAGVTTNTSATSIRSSFSFDGSTSVTVINKNEQVKNPLENWEEQSRNSTPVSDQSEQVLMVRDTGATPTMSPNPDFERKQRSKKRQSTSPVKKNTKKDGEFDPWLGGWDELSRRPLEEKVRASKSPAEPSTTTVPTTSLKSTSSSLPPISTVPGLVTMNRAGPAAQQVTSWMGSVGKRLGEIRDSPTFTKNQKRASLLLTDMQNTFVSSLISLPPASSSPLITKEEDKLSYMAPSLLDEFDECEMTGGGPNTGMITAPVLVPSVRKSPLKRDRGLEAQSKPGGSDTTTRTLLTTPVLVPSVRKSPNPSSTKRDGCVLETGSKGGSESEDDWNW